MTNIRNAEGNNLSEVISDTINQVTNQFSEGINAMFSGFKSMSSNFGLQGFQSNGQQQSSHNTHRFNQPPTSDEITAERLASQRRMDATIPFGEEDLRAIGNN